MSIASERQQRKVAKEIVGDNFVAERAPFTFSPDKTKEEIQDVPFCYRPNLIAAIADTIERHDR